MSNFNKLKPIFFSTLDALNDKSKSEEDKKNCVESYFRIKETIGELNLNQEDQSLISKAENLFKEYIETKEIFLINSKAIKFLNHVLDEINKELEEKQSLILALPQIENIYAKYLYEKQDILKSSSKIDYEIFVKFEKAMVEVLTSKSTKALKIIYNIKNFFKA